MRSSRDLRAQLDQHVLHAAGFVLEYAVGATLRQHPEHRRVVHPAHGSIEKSGSFRRTIFSASLSTVRVLRPKKSIFRSPSSSSVVMVYWVTTASSFFARGT